jgi:hypothetical protein
MPITPSGLRKAVASARRGVHVKEKDINLMPEWILCEKTGIE